jgi:DNA repair protein RecN (Recombination protein N)
MLKSLQIKNFTLIENVFLDFSPNLNIITGETGAGKSVIVDALMLALGDRGSSDVVRKSSKKAMIECVFVLPVSHPIFRSLEENDYDIFDNEVILRREISNKGVSRCFVNDTPIPVSTLKEFGDILVDFHGQHDHQILLNSKSHINILDSISDLHHLLEEYKIQYNSLKELIISYEEICTKSDLLKENADLMQHELSEIIYVNPEENEEEKIEEDLRILENSELLLNLTSEAFSELYESENSAHERISKAVKAIQQLARIDSRFSVYINESNSALIAIDEIANFARDYSSSIDFDPERTEQLRERAIQIKALRKKYGSIRKVLERKDFLEDELSLVKNLDHEINKKKELVLGKKTEVAEIISKISNIRQERSLSFSNALINKLHLLGINKADFRVEITQNETTISGISDLSVEIGNKHYKLTSKGIDKVEFLISTNPGEPLKPLAKIASGGEISRVMLAMKSILADSEDLPILVFDEIDTGISGRIAQIVGMEMRQLSEKHQIISITHLPQIAAMAHRNIKIEKSESNGQSIISGKSLDDEDSLREVAKLISGSEVTAASLESAKELQKIRV